MDESQKLAVEQFANIEIIKFMMLDLWGVYLLEQNDALARAATFRERHLQLLQQALDEMPDSVVRNALLDKAEENWQQIFRRLKAEGSLAKSK